ncbi:MAG: translocation/assembly module TamB domain-containing protein [Cypionkella sp.]
MRYGFALVAVLLPIATAAQTTQNSDRDYLTAFLEDNLSGAGRQVVITGFQGALSSTASLATLTIADDQGIWLTLRDVSLDWSRSSLLSGKVVITELSAKDIELARLPATDPKAMTPEAGVFSLPELPVSIDIGKIAADHISLGPTVMGQAVEARLEASMQLADGEGEAKLLLERTDAGPAGKIDLTVSYANANKQLVIDLAAEEAKGGIFSTLLRLPETPAVSLTVKGAGPVSDFAADVALKTDGADRLAGKVELKAAEKGAMGFSADIGGDLAPLFLPQYAEFFGNDVKLVVQGQRWPDGRLALEQMKVAAKALQLNGSLALASDGLPTKFDLTGRIADPQGRPVVLPLTTALPVQVSSADVTLRYDPAQAEGWAGNITVDGLVRDDFRASNLRVAGSGRIDRVAGKRLVGGSFKFSGEGLEPKDAALARALGSVIWGDALAYWREGDGSLTISRLNLGGEDYTATASARIAGLADALTVAGNASASVGDLGRFSGLAGRSLAGAADLTLTGSASPITGAFDISATAKGRDMKAGIAQLDQLLKGDATLAVSALRDTDGITLRSANLAAQSLKVDAEGRLASDRSDITATLDFADLGDLGGGYRGALAGTAHLTGSLADGRVTLEAQGRNLSVGQSEADKLLAGTSQVAVDLALKDGTLKVTSAKIDNPQLNATASGVLDGTQQRVTIDARLANLALLVPQFPGQVSVSGTALQDASGVTLDLKAQGPGQIDATVAGKIAAGYRTANLAIKGSAQAALANAFIGPMNIQGQTNFDLALNGPLALASLSGPVTLSKGQLANPSLPFSLQNIAARANLAGGRAAIGASFNVSTGGSVTVQGSAGLSGGYDGDLKITLNNAILRDPELYETRLNGSLSVTGPLAGGAVIAGTINVAEAEIRVPSTGFGGAAGLPDLKHVNEPADVKATRARAGLIAKGTANATPRKAYGLDILVSAPSRVFIRGRGLDAELGGQLRLSGTSDNVSPIGAFKLLRGRLDLLGKRLDLTDAVLQLEGTLVPYLHVVASTTNDGIMTGVEIDGPANDPTVSFTSNPELPQEEVLAQLLFGQGLQNLSAFQALQLANAVATLAGRGGEGIISKLRRGTGLDNLDVKTGADGGTEITAGKYLSKKLYSEVTVDGQGKSQVNLNLDISKSIKLQAHSGTDGNTGLGVVLQKDY